jgi:hypothetical protein
MKASGQPKRTEVFKLLVVEGYLKPGNAVLSMNHNGKTFTAGDILEDGTLLYEGTAPASTATANAPRFMMMCPRQQHARLHSVSSRWFSASACAAGRSSSVVHRQLSAVPVPVLQGSLTRPAALPAS